LTCLFICGNGIFYIFNIFRRLRAFKMSMNKYISQCLREKRVHPGREARAP